ncbi:hypothetical protein EZ428_04010 [Pedobacter frigiditerrae]|uniref:Preprotein translocase subunit SecD n=1 Tax=Pedobacter frigiditerrae TaxID=2530452 RepID=A0A4V2MJE3_9SPHI|nr:hypothetical protein [Pedobacter frigiditerrae]TCC93946.1 hypothetical protein EZ428_04010 [Pedobacter frigiditerrae]
MKNYIYLILALFISSPTFAQKPANKQATTKTTPKTKFFIDEKEADILVAKLIDPDNYASVDVAGISPADMTQGAMPKKPTSLNMSTKPGAKFITLAQFFERYKVPTAYQQMIKVNGELLTIRDNFLANESRVAKVELSKGALDDAFINIITK